MPTQALFRVPNPCAEQRNATLHPECVGWASLSPIASPKDDRRLQSRLQIFWRVVLAPGFHGGLGEVADFSATSTFEKQRSVDGEEEGCYSDLHAGS